MATYLVPGGWGGFRSRLAKWEHKEKKVQLNLCHQDWWKHCRTALTHHHAVWLHGDSPALSTSPYSTVCPQLQFCHSAGKAGAPSKINITQQVGVSELGVLKSLRRQLLCLHFQLWQVEIANENKRQIPLSLLPVQRKGRAGGRGEVLLKTPSRGLEEVFLKSTVVIHQSKSAPLFHCPGCGKRGNSWSHQVVSGAA